MGIYIYVFIKYLINSEKVLGQIWGPIRLAPQTPKWGNGEMGQGGTLARLPCAPTLGLAGGCMEGEAVGLVAPKPPI